VTPASDGCDAAADPDAADRTPPGNATATVGDAAGRPAVGDATDDLQDGGISEVDPVVFRTFWGSVLAVDVALAAVPLGLLVIYFRGDWELGGLALAVGAVAAVGAVHFYLIFRADRRDGREAAP
jgi:hypothetical protein